MKNFQESDVYSWESNHSLFGSEKTKYYSLQTCDREDLVYDPPEWMAAGLQETASGYGMRLNTGMKVSFQGKLFRVYCTIFSNAGSCWFKTKGRKIFVS